MPDLTAIPILRSPDLPATAAFYSDQLGFSVEWAGPEYLLLRRDGIELHFAPPDFSDGRATESCCYIRGGGIDSLHDEFAARDVPGFMPFRHQPWGMYEFFVSDPHGCLLKFGRSDREDPAPACLVTKDPA